LKATPTPHLRLLADMAISPAHRVPWALVNASSYLGVGSLSLSLTS
jgi:hypothetical protein